VRNTRIRKLAPTTNDAVVPSEVEESRGETRRLFSRDPSTTLRFAQDDSGSQMKRAVVLLSGGIDSTTTLAMAIAEGNEAYALSFDYGQRHQIETEAARRVAESLGVKEQRIAKIDMRIFGGSALTDDIDVPKDRAETEIAHGIPVTYVPARNMIFLTYAFAWAEVISANHIFLGVNAIDYSGYPDCRPEFIEAFETLANLGTKAGVEGRRFQIHTPLIKFSKAEIIRKAVELGVDLSLTHSCYDPSPEGLACGECDSCLLRLKGFREARIEDPIRYAKK
jgi:7-cyano-7-deazaguanine synthase